MLWIFWFATLWLIVWFKLMDILRSFEMCGTLVHIYIYIYIYISLYSVFCRLLWFVPMPCSLVLVVLSCITLSTLTLVDFISLMQFPCVVALVECWTCK